MLNNFEEKVTHFNGQIRESSRPLTKKIQYRARNSERRIARPQSVDIAGTID